MSISVGTSSYLLASGAALTGTISTTAVVAPAFEAGIDCEASTFEQSVPSPFFAREGRHAASRGGGAAADRTPELMQQLRDSSFKRRAEAARLLGENRERVAVDRLSNMAMKEKSRHVRQAAIEALGKIGDPAQIAPIARLAGEDNYDEVRHTCVRALLDIGTQEAMDRLSEIASENPSSSVRYRAASALAEAGDLRAVHHLLTSIAISPSLSDHAYTYLEAFGAAAVPQLVEALGSTRWPVRLWSAILLGKAGDAAASPSLVERIKHDDEHEVRFKAIQAIARIADEGGYEMLVEGLGDPDGVVRMRCREAVRTIGKPMEGALLSAPGKTGTAKDREITIALARLGNASAINATAAIIYDEQLNVEVRGEACEAYCNIKDPRAPALLANIDSLHEISDPGLRAKIDGYLERAEATDGGGMVEQARPQIEQVADAIAQRLIAALGLSFAPDLFGADVEGYDEVSVRGAGGLRLGQRQMLLPIRDTICIDEGADEETKLAMLRSLNFLVPHAIAHVAQEEWSTPRPAVDTSGFPRFKPERIAEAANEAMLDGMAFRMATEIYVHRDGDTFYEEDVRGSIAIGAVIALHGIVLADHNSGRRPLPEEEVARMMAVERSLAFHDSASKNAKLRLRGLADRFKASIVSKMNNGHRKALERLVRTLQQAFEKAKLASE